MIYSGRPLANQWPTMGPRVKATSPLLNGHADTTLTEQVGARLEASIAARDLGANGRLPSERRLAEAYGVSRMTIRAALQTLRAKGVVEGEPRYGMFVARGRVDHAAGMRLSFTEEMRARGQIARSRVLETSIIPASLDLARIFGVVAGTLLVRISRVRLADDMPLGWEVSHLPSAMFPGLESHDFERASLYATLEGVYGLRFSRSRQVVEAALPTKEERDLLDLPPRTPVLRVSSTSGLDDDRVIEYVRGVWRGDRYLLTIESGYATGLGQTR